jgi:hypothetical protein
LSPRRSRSWAISGIGSWSLTKRMVSPERSAPIAPKIAE